MTEARKEITSLMARDTDEWQWGRLHTVTLRNQTLGTSGIAPIERLFNRGEYQVGGGPAVVNAMAYDDTLGYTVASGADHADAGRPRRSRQSRWVNQSGVSGHAFHRNYDDQTAVVGDGNRMWPFVSVAVGGGAPAPPTGSNCIPRRAGSGAPMRPVRSRRMDARAADRIGAQAVIRPSPVSLRKNEDSA